MEFFHTALKCCDVYRKTPSNSHVFSYNRVRNYLYSILLSHGLEPLLMQPLFDTNSSNVCCWLPTLKNNLTTREHIAVQIILNIK